ncbi:unnamed protein product [Plutella xylostella]|uniref:(diamondback moth) hypothetical protein n=1 Tax=Plutella xylostella TaxID=51655 RepID=A0A8S4E4W4_PLUXY|nr:unnamed protein product [Plutella xylostella]
MKKTLCTDKWFEICYSIISAPDKLITEDVMYTQIQIIWFLRRILLEHNGPKEWRRTAGSQLLALIGRLWLETHPSDPALRPNQQAFSPMADEEEIDNRWRAAATASYTGAVCGALVQLMRQLHDAPQWHSPVAALLLDKLRVAAQMSRCPEHRWRWRPRQLHGAARGALLQLMRQLHDAPQWHSPVAALLRDKTRLAAQMIATDWHWWPQVSDDSDQSVKHAPPTLEACLVAGALGVVGGAEFRVRIGQRVLTGSPSRPAIVTQFTPRAKIMLLHDDNTVSKVEMGGLMNAESERLPHPLGGGESALRVCAALLGAPPPPPGARPCHLPAEVDVYTLRRQQMELLTLCAVRGLLTNRTRLRKVLMQPPDNGIMNRSDSSEGTEGTLLRRLLGVATRPSPLSAAHTPAELAAAALAVAQQLAHHATLKCRAEGGTLSAAHTLAELAAAALAVAQQLAHHATLKCRAEGESTQSPCRHSEGTGGPLSAAHTPAELAAATRHSSVERRTQRGYRRPAVGRAHPGRARRRHATLKCRAEGESTQSPCRHSEGTGGPLSAAHTPAELAAATRHSSVERRRGYRRPAVGRAHPGRARRRHATLKCRAEGESTQSPCRHSEGTGGPLSAAHTPAELAAATRHSSVERRVSPLSRHVDTARVQEARCRPRTPRPSSPPPRDTQV